MGKTIKVASDRAYDTTKSVLPTEYARGVFIEHAPTAQGLKLMHLMIVTAGGALAEDRVHELQLSTIRKTPGFKNHDKSSLTPLFREIRSATFSFDDPEAKEVRIGGFLDTAKIDYRHEHSGEVTIRWWFSRLFREIAEASDHWAIMDRQTVFALKSRYSILLFQYIASLVNLEHRSSEVLTLQNLRAVLSVPDGKLMRWNDLNRYALMPAIAEINQLARFSVEIQKIKHGRHVDAVRLVWAQKVDLTATKRELGGSKVGRKARREGQVETPALAFPDQGSVKYTTPWEKIARDNVPPLPGSRSLPDLGNLGNDFRRWAQGKGVPLDAPTIEKIFASFCKGYRP